MKRELCKNCGNALHITFWYQIDPPDEPLVIPDAWNDMITYVVPDAADYRDVQLVRTVYLCPNCHCEIEVLERAGE